MTKLQQIREIIIKSNSEIVELKFGCRVESEDNKYIYTYIGRALKDNKHWYINDVVAVCNDARNTKEDGLIKGKIIGRPIRLDDVAQVTSINEKRWLIEHWKPGYLHDQSEKTLDGISLRML